ncbi:MAG TPA: HAD family hydrolase [Vicinamibacterales bacterium]|nr:HAD family hydrolase [Vicinamibacterales bacterium]
MTSPADAVRRIRAVLFDLDGTLYDQRRLRLWMSLSLLGRTLINPVAGLRRLRIIAAYRHAQEELRAASPQAAAGGLADAQVAVAASRTGLPAADIRAVIEEWMNTRPLRHLAACRVPGLDRLLGDLAGSGVRLGLLSDYPAAAKLEALGLAGQFDPILSASDPEIGAFKPSPRGYLRACQVWGLEPHEVLFVGDRAEVDAAGAAAAGMPCVIIGRGGDAGSPAGYLCLPSLERLRAVLDEGRVPKR